MVNKLGGRIILAALLFNGIVGGLSVDYISSWFSKNIPIIYDVLIGLVFAEFTIPIAVLGWLIKLF
ncbi:hypothetical protein G6Z34_13895 [Clostridium perfringens]|uniref:Uncharacterized protein n=1 Tax=Clostridium perfringens TaxID=1502 RepID=A0AAP7BWS1_CLOPF|nr:hypothetical protein [Clostridium perfringens]NGU31178.1 hypothetical protein [Clostridium perfringens]